jgi:hypothetical protein
MDQLKRTHILLAIMNLIFFAGMITVNALANILPINGLTTGELSAFYPNLFVPAGLTFSIWGLIYILLFMYVIFALIMSLKGTISGILTFKSQVTFALTCLFNAIWIFMWHYKLIVWSEILMLSLLIALIFLFVQTRRTCGNGWKNCLFIKIPVQVYLGWITVATIANSTALLVAKNWGAWGIADNVWTITMILIGAAVTVVMLWRHRTIAYALVVIWAYTGIIIKRTTADIQYPDIIFTAALAMGIILVLIIYALIRKTPEKTS